MGNDVILDEAAEALFRELGGADISRASSKYDMTGLTETLHDHDRGLDSWRSLMITFIRDVAGFLTFWQKGDLRAAEKTLVELELTLQKLEKKEGNDGKILVRYQGRGIEGEGRASAAYDYVVYFGGIALDIPQARACSRRLGAIASEFPGIFVSGLSSLAENSINTLYFRLAGDGEVSPKARADCLTAMGAFLKALALEKAKSPASSRDKSKAPYILDENGEPDPNLTAFAIINKQKKNVVQGLVPKIQAVMAKEDCGQALLETTSVYESIFAFEKLRRAMSRPVIEINNLRYEIVLHEGEMVMPEEARTARITGALFGKNSFRSARLLDTLYSSDFHFLSPYLIVDRLGLCSRLMESIENSGQQSDKRSIIPHILEMVELRLEVIDDEVIERLAVQGYEISAKISRGEFFKTNIHAYLMDLVLFFKQRARTRKKVKSMLRRCVNFDAEDFETISRDFGISIAAADDLIGLLRKCFDSQGHFLRGAFESNIPAFCAHQDKVFEFLWHFLKNHMHKNERISFLNALKALIDKMSGSDMALYVLLHDFVKDPDKITFSDRNALILCNALLRKFNKELHQDIEMTPEEVIKVVAGLDRDAVEFARDLIDKEKEQFFLKFRQIHSDIRETLDNHQTDNSMPIGYLFTLEREVYMLFALVGGVTGHAILRSGLREYGDPESGIYEFPESQNQLSWLLQILQVIIRAIGRIGDEEDLVLLREIRPRTTYFMNLKTDSRHTDQVKRLMRWLDRSEEMVKMNIDKAAKAT